MTTTTTTTMTTTTGNAITTTKIPSDFIPPAKETLLHEGEEISEEEYNVLMNTAKLFGIGEYKIVWSDVPIKYGYTDPGMYYCMQQGIAYGVGVQIISIEDIRTVCPNIDEFTASFYEFFYDGIMYRPTVEADYRSEVLEGRELGGDVHIENDILISGFYNLGPATDSEYSTSNFEYAGWYLIPTADGEESLSMVNNYYPDKVDIPDNKYWFTSEQINGLSRYQLHTFLKMMEKYNIENAKFVKSSTIIQYGFIIGGNMITNSKNQFGVQMIPGEDVRILFPELENWLRNQYPDDVSQELVEKEKEKYYTDDTVCWGLTTYESDSDFYPKGIFIDTNVWVAPTWYMIPLDENGNEIYRLWFPV